MSVMQQNPNGTWSPATPLPYFPGPDFEVSTREGRQHWQMFEGAALLAEGTARTRIGAAFAMRLARRREMKARAARV